MFDGERSKAGAFALHCICIQHPLESKWTMARELLGVLRVCGN